MQLLPLLLCCSPVLVALSTVRQFPQSVEVMAGEPVTLECRFDLVIQYCYTVNWMKLNLTTNMLTTYENKRIDGSSPSAFKCMLSIDNATERDSGVYYCSIAHGNMVYVGNGSTVRVIGNTSKIPSIEVFVLPESRDGGVSAPVPLLCLVSDLAQSPVRVSWVIGGRAENGSNEYSWTNTPSKMLWTQNLVLVPAAEWNGGTLCTCIVEFAGQRFFKSVQHQGRGTLCLTLLYVASGAAALVTIVTISVLVCLCCGKNKYLYISHYITTQQTVITSHRQLKPMEGSCTLKAEEIHYATLDAVNLGRHKKPLMES
ncbi:hypothetical protein GN956_G18076 [Arapaima gigas]